MHRLKKYNFTDELGHPLENCQDWIDLINELNQYVEEEKEYEEMDSIYEEQRIRNEELAYDNY